jgi:hypothetical protein
MTTQLLRRLQVSGAPRKVISVSKPLVFALAGTLIFGSVAANDYAFDNAPIAFTLDQAAQLTFAEFDVIVEAIVISSSLVSIERDNHCIWVTQLQLRKEAEIKGQVTNEPFSVVTRSVTEIPEPRGCGVAQIDENPPAVGDRGLFLLVTDSNDHRALARNMPTLWSAKYNLLRKGTDGRLTRFLRGTPYQWPYQDFVAALHRQASELTIVEAIGRAPLIVIGHRDDGQPYSIRYEGPDSVQWFDYPLQIDEVIRGSNLSRISFSFSMDDRQHPDLAEGVTRGTLGRWLAARLKSSSRDRILVLGERLGNERLRPVGLGFVRIENEQVILPSVIVAVGSTTNATIPLAEVREEVK